MGIDSNKSRWQTRPLWNEIQSASGAPTIKALRHRITSLYLFNSQRNGTTLTGGAFKSAWARAMANAMESGSLTESFAENDLRAKVANEAVELGQNATAMLGHSSDAVTKRHYQRGTQKVEPLRKKY